MTWMYPAMWYHDRVFLLRCSVLKCGKLFFFSQVFFTKISCLELVRELVFTGNWPCQNVAKVTFFLQTHTVFLKRLHIFWDKIRSIFFQNFPGIYRELLISRLRCFPRFPGKEQCYQLFIVFSTFSLPKCGQKLCVSPKSNVCYFFSQTSFFRIKTCFFGNSLVFPRICWFQSRLLGLLPKISREKRVCQFCNCFLKSNVFLQNQKMLGNCSRMFNIYIYIFRCFSDFFIFGSDSFQICFIFFS